MKPVNLNTAPCAPVSSNCVIWQGPDIPCINLCNGDTVSDVVYALATELCTILDTLNVTNYDLTCFNLTACAPSNFHDLIQFLIAQVCAANGITTTPDTTTGCPDCLVTVAPCFVSGGVTTMNLTDYVNTIANKICNIIDEISIINATLNVLDIRVTTLENKPDPTFTIPSFTLGCDIDTLNSGDTYQIDVILEAFINNVWCTFSSAIGTATAIFDVLEPQCTLSTDITTDPNWIASPQNLADAINNIWVSLCNLPPVTVTGSSTTTVDVSVSSGPAYTVTADIVDTGWHDLNGFDFMGAWDQRPQARRVGSVIYFRGIVVPPMGDATSGSSGTVIPHTTSSAYHAIPYPKVLDASLSADTNACTITTSGGVGIQITYNRGTNVIPAAVWAGTIDNETVFAGRQLSYRRIDASGETISLTMSYALGITVAGNMYVSTVAGTELYSGTGLLGSSSQRFVTSNVRAGEYIPDYIAATSDIDNAPSNANFPLVSETHNVTWPFDCDAGNAQEIGGFLIRLDGLTAFIA